ncbi:MAG: dihydrolipoamide acetyltransferase family protein, partial [Fimbriimonadaceae bacterium]
PILEAPATQAASGVLEASRVKASPVARKFAETHSIDLEQCSPGSGPDGRVLLEDVKAKEGQAPTAPSAPPPTAKPTPPPVMASGTSERKPMSKMRAAIGRNLQASKQNVPHFYMRVTVNADGLTAYREREKQLYKCSVNDVVTEACARVIMEMPEFRTQVDGDHLVTHADANIGLAVALEGGLVVPVVRAANRMNLQGIAEEARRIAEEARKGKIEGQGEGVFTISNLGMYGVEEFSAIINPPEAAILAVGAVREEVYADNGAIRVGKRLTMTLSSDHRVIDGVAAAKFCARLREILESLGD